MSGVRWRSFGMALTALFDDVDHHDDLRVPAMPCGGEHMLSTSIRLLSWVVRLLLRR